jgi:glucose-1-phosphate adenylyltransferase
MRNVLVILLAGGAGERLAPLTRRLAKPAVRFGGIYRLIDFTLSNCINSGLRRIFCLTQYKSLELVRHLREGWDLLPGELGEFIEVLPPMKRIHSDWYLGTADAVYQNIESIEAEQPTHVLILAADHIYRMDYREILDWHMACRASATIATCQVPPAEVDRYGVADINPETYRIRGFEEKPAHGAAVRSPFNPTMCSASMGVYLFETKTLTCALRADANDPDSSHDFGRDVIPSLIHSGNVVAYDFNDLNAKGSPYWRDVGTLDAYYEANMDLVSVSPEFNLYNQAWPVRTQMPQAPPAKFVFAMEGKRMGIATDSIVSPGVIVSGGRVNRSLLGPGVRVNSYCEVESSILLDGANVGRYSRLHRAILDCGVNLPEESEVGFNPEKDRAAGYYVTESGVTVVPGP